MNTNARVFRAAFLGSVAFVSVAPTHVLIAALFLQSAFCSTAFGDQQSPPQLLSAEPADLNALSQAYSEKMKARAEACGKKCGEINNAAKADQQKRSDDMEEEGKKTNITVKGRWEMAREDWKIMVPEVSMKEQKISFDVPKLTMQRQGVKIEVPVLVMRTVAGPDIKYGSVEWRNDGFLNTPSPTYHEIVQHTSYDVPTVDMRLQEYTWDMPAVSGTERCEISVLVPHITMKEQKIAFQHPVFITEDIGVGPDKDKLEQQKRDSIAVSEKTKTEVNAVTEEMKVGLKEDFLWYAPRLLMYQCGTANQQITESAAESQKALKLAWQEDVKLRNAKVPPGNPARVATQNEISKHTYLLSIYSNSANGAIYSAYTKGIDDLKQQAQQIGVTADELFVEVSSYGLSLPPVANYNIKFEEGGSVQIGR